MMRLEGKSKNRKVKTKKSDFVGFLAISHAKFICALMSDYWFAKIDEPFKIVEKPTL
jgi:hypothetical protein